MHDLVRACTEKGNGLAKADNHARAFLLQARALGYVTAEGGYVFHTSIFLEHGIEVVDEHHAVALILELKRLPRGGCQQRGANYPG